MKHSSFRGFALISTLAVLVVVSILVVAYMSTIRVERGASVNFSERERADAIGQAMVSRLLADHATPEVSPGVRLKPFSLKVTAAGKPDPSKLPDKATEDTYFAEVPKKDIYTIEPQKNLSSKNSLVRISQVSSGDTEGSEEAYTPYDWAYSRVPVTPTSDDETKQAFLPYSSSDKLVAPRWMDYYSPEENGDVPIGEVAFAIWDESGKIDINMAGQDATINGLGPHNLGFEKLASSSDRQNALLTYLGGTDTKRQRSNFSLRAITDNIGDDRPFFAVDELFMRKYFPSQAFKQITTFSRDFDVRPEWDGNRAAASAKTFLRSFINNPQLFKLFTDTRASSKLVSVPAATPALALDEARLMQVLKNQSIVPDDDWMQVMRLLVALRVSFPPFYSVPSVLFDSTNPPTLLATLKTPATVGSSADVTYNIWTDDDIYGIALNIMQAAAPVADENLFAFDRKTYNTAPFSDVNTRVGIRVSPYVTESAVSVKRMANKRVIISEYIEVWNPYAVDLRTQNYYYGTWTGSRIEAGTKEPDTTSTLGMGTRYTTPGPAAGGFITLKLPDIDVTNAVYDFAAGKPFILRTRPYLQHVGYYGNLITGSANGVESHAYAVTIGPFFTGGGASRKYNLVYNIPADRLAKDGDVAWASFQIDDPRMGPYTRYAFSYPESGTESTNLTNMRYSWKYFLDQHSLYNHPGVDGAAKAKRIVSTNYGDPFGPNFGENAPPGFDFARMKATFALPRRQLMNVGELGSVFANKPWRTLSFASTSAPQDDKLLPPAKTKNYPTSLLDYLTTIGTSSPSNKTIPQDLTAPLSTTLNYKPAGGVASATILGVSTRKRDDRFLFEYVDKNGTVPDQYNGHENRLRPIRGRINLNSASVGTLTSLLSAPYRVPRWNGVLTEWPLLSPTPVSTAVDSDVTLTINPKDAEKVALEITGDEKTPSLVRPFRTMADLGRLQTIRTILHKNYPDPLADAVIGRLAQFGTIRQQVFRVDMAARALNRNVEKQRLTNPSIKRVVTAEVRFQTRLYFDTFSRKAFVESIEYR